MSTGRFRRAADGATDVNTVLYLFFRFETAAAVILATLAGTLGYEWFGIAGAVLGGTAGLLVGFFGVLAWRVLG